MPSRSVSAQQADPNHHRDHGIVRQPGRLLAHDGGADRSCQRGSCCCRPTAARADRHQQAHRWPCVRCRPGGRQAGTHRAHCHNPRAGAEATHQARFPTSPRRSARGGSSGGSLRGLLPSSRRWLGTPSFAATCSVRRMRSGTVRLPVRWTQQITLTVVRARNAKGRKAQAGIELVASRRGVALRFSRSALAVDHLAMVSRRVSYVFTTKLRNQ